MTWDELTENIRKGLNESGSHLRAVGNLMAKVSEGENAFDDEVIGAAVALLVMAVSNIHSAVEHLGIGLDAVVEAMKKASKSQEVKGE